VSSPSGSPEAERARQAEIAEVRRSCPPLKIPHCQGLSTEAFGLALFELIGAHPWGSAQCRRRLSCIRPSAGR
jgi:hypothetical protein